MMLVAVHVQTYTNSGCHTNWTEVIALPHPWLAWRSADDAGDLIAGTSQLDSAFRTNSTGASLHCRVSHRNDH